MRGLNSSDWTRIINVSAYWRFLRCDNGFSKTLVLLTVLRLKPNLGRCVQKFPEPMARRHQIKVKGRSQLLATWPDRPTRVSINIGPSFSQYTGVAAGSSRSNSLEGLVLVCRKLSDLVFTRNISYRVLGQRSSKGLDTGSWEQRHYKPLQLWCKQKMGQRLTSCLRLFLVEYS
jgi:hypothetical protein